MPGFNAWRFVEGWMLKLGLLLVCHGNTPVPEIVRAGGTSQCGV